MRVYFRQLKNNEGEIIAIEKLEEEECIAEVGDIIVYNKNSKPNSIKYNGEDVFYFNWSETISINK